MENNTPAPTEEFKPWGYHAILDCSNCDLIKIQDTDNIRAWVAEVITIIGATAHGITTVEKSGIGDSNKEGNMLVQLLQIGLITANFIDNSRHAYIDVFSCTAYEPKTVEDLTKRFFGENITVLGMTIPRNAAAPLPPQ